MDSPTKDLNAEKLKARAFDKIRDIALMDGRELLEAGHGSIGVAVRKVIIETHREIENGNS